MPNRSWPGTGCFRKEMVGPWREGQQEGVTIVLYFPQRSMNVARKMAVLLLCLNNIAPTQGRKARARFFFRASLGPLKCGSFTARPPNSQTTVPLPLPFRRRNKTRRKIGGIPRGIPASDLEPPFFVPRDLILEWFNLPSNAPGPGPVELRTMFSWRGGVRELGLGAL